MVIEKRRMPMFILLNILTLGIYGFVQSMKMGKEIDALSEGDGEQPRFSYAVAVLFRAIPALLGLLGGLIVGAAMGSVAGVLGGALNSVIGFLDFLPSDVLDVFDVVGEFLGDYGTIVGDIESFAAAYASNAVLFRLASSLPTLIVVGCAVIGMFTAAAAGRVLSGIYLNYWWYRQNYRLKLNANRYGLVVNEKGSDIFLFRTFFDAAVLPLNFAFRLFSLFVPMLLVALIFRASPVAAAIIFLFICIAFCFFDAELTIGATFTHGITSKNLNRFADVAAAGAAPFDPMAYEYYPSATNFYNCAIPDALNGRFVTPTPTEISGIVRDVVAEEL
ncbi:MAG: DUF4234 domain-containing protein, partial [Clostridia bacterium]|nr:DUF4234 domain-containing protein [Clostridia bacterium]